MTALELTLATSRLNSRIRGRGLSAREMLTQRDQFNHQQLPIEDLQLIIQQHETKLTNHALSEKSKTPSGRVAIPPNSTVGDLVYLSCDRNKSRARDRYLVVACDGQWRDIRKFAGSQLRRTSYRVKDSECYTVPTVSLGNPTVHDSSAASEEDEADELEHTDILTPYEPPKPPNPPVIPPVIQQPLTDGDYFTGDNLDPPQHMAPVVPKVGSSRPSRDRKPPKWLDDYILQ